MRWRRARIAYCISMTAESPMREILVEARAVAREYGQGAAAVAAVTNASCTIALGDRTAVFGASGSGKSTLLYLLAGLEPPSSGAIVWPSLGSGERLMPTFAGFVFQLPNLLPPLTAAENVAVPLLIAGVPPQRAREAALLMLERFVLRDVADRNAEDLSGGQAERVGLARALVSEPSLVLA